MESPIKPIYLFADSQLLFWKKNNGYYLENIRQQFQKKDLKAAYVGISNKDNIEFFELFKSAMELINVQNVGRITSLFSQEEKEFLEDSDIILLAGGDVFYGWRKFEKKGINQIITKKYFDGSVLMGLSAGAIQLGVYGWEKIGDEIDQVVETFKFIPFIISVHQEKQDWQDLKSMLKIKNGNYKGIGIPSGGGLIYHSDHSIEPIRSPLNEYVWSENKMHLNLLFPKAEKEEKNESNR